MKKKGYLLTSLLLAAILSVGIMCGCGNTASDEEKIMQRQQKRSRKNRRPR